MKTKVLFLTVFLAANLVGACDNDPGKGKAKATTGEAQPTSAEAKSTPSAAATTYKFDGTNSKIEWVGAKVTKKHDGGYKTFTGDVKIPGNDVTKGSVNVDIDIDSMFTDDPKLLGHLKSPDFFDVAKFPKATFASTEVKAGGEKGHIVTGNLTMHGVTKSITFPATIKQSGENVDVNADFVINRKDFGIVYPGMANDLIKEEVNLKLDVHAKKAS